jgi:hypothetical protein
VSLAPVLAALACAAGLVGAIAVGSRTAAPPAAPFAGEPLRFKTELTPRAAHFGDRVVARLAISAEPGEKPERVGVTARFSPYRIVGAPQLERARSGGRTVLTHVFRLECISSECVPGLGRERQLRFPPARVEIGEESYALEWPTLSIASRVTPAEARSGALRADATDPVAAPARSSSTGWLFVGGAGLLLGGLAAALLRPGAPALARLRPRAPEEDDVARALRRAREHVGSGDPERRVALDDLACALERAGRRDDALAVRRLAWARGRAAPVPVLEALAAARNAA